MGVGVSRVTSIWAFDDLWRRAILFFSFLSSCLVCFSPAILQKCAAVNTNSALAVNYSSHPWQSAVLTALKCTSFDHWRGPSSALCQSGDPPSLITNVIVQASPYHWKGSHAEAQQPEMSAMWGETAPDHSREFEVAPWRLEPAAVPPGCQNDHDSSARFC